MSHLRWLLHEIHMSLPEELSRRNTLGQDVKPCRGWRLSAATGVLGMAVGVIAAIGVASLVETESNDVDLDSLDQAPHTDSEAMVSGREMNARNLVIVGEETVLPARLPPDARTWWFQLSGSADTPVQHVSTPFGVAFKTESLLFGPCVSVEYAYRKIPDSSYSTRCYDSQLQTVSMPLARRLVPDLVGADHRELERLVAEMNPVLLNWVPNDEVPEGQVLEQDQRVGVSIPEYSPIEVTISAGGPVVSWRDLPQPIKAWLQSANLQLLESLRREKYVYVDTDFGGAYKTDALLFGPCEAVRSAYGTFQDKHYSTLVPEPCERIP